MFVAGIDAHATYSVIAIVSNAGQLVHGPVRIKNADADQLTELLEAVSSSGDCRWKPVPLGRGSSIDSTVTVSTSCSLTAKRIRVIAESNYKSDEIDAELLARMRLAGLIPEVYAKCIEQREQAVLLRNRARLVRERTRMVNRIHAQLHNVGLHLERGRLLTQNGRQWVRTVAWPRLGEERRLFIDMQWALIDQIVPMIRTLDRRVEHMGRKNPAVALLETVPGIGPYRALLIATETFAHHTIPNSRSLGQLRRSRSTLLTVRSAAHSPRIDPRRCQQVAEGHLCPGRRQPCHVRTRQLAVAVLRTHPAASRMAGRSSRYRPSPRSCRARHAPYG